MARLNTLNLNPAPRTHEGTPTRHVSPEIQLRRSVLACLLWENQFYEDGIEIACRIAELLPKVAAEKVAALAIEAREQMKLRHAPLLLVREMARHKTHRAPVSETLASILQRADELAEFVAIYWKDGRVPLSGQVKKGWPRPSRSLTSISSLSMTVAGPSSCGMYSSSAMPSHVMGLRQHYGRS
jgi:60 kDa SS-A/Ro ribonucleoprotein